MTSIEFAGQVALVTGASRGIGYESALALAKAGAHVVATAPQCGANGNRRENITGAAPGGDHDFQALHR